MEYFYFSRFSECKIDSMSFIEFSCFLLYLYKRTDTKYGFSSTTGKLLDERVL